MKIRSLDANSEIRANAGIAPARQSDVTGSAEAQKPSRRSTHYKRTGHALQSDKAMDAPVTNYYAVHQLLCSKRLVSSGGLLAVNTSVHGDGKPIIGLYARMQKVQQSLLQ
ncbi:hypothetical protein FHR59_003740 [Xanthomonas arboricola]|uniref:hypothetical protein n=1 Tax=Xanthomonas arboricola TaxID=56448 RepID=UPI0011AFFCEB|nr:hypothetical protein [Xanthomonas arboricola]MBB6339450.1 hypothetical protein [Xanthomonas arboricola]UOS98405.1 hypothetical protein LZZ50_18175 [Xanthomonas arboricola]